MLYRLYFIFGIIFTVTAAMYALTMKPYSSTLTLHTGNLRDWDSRQKSLTLLFITRLVALTKKLVVKDGVLTILSVWRRRKHTLAHNLCVIDEFCVSVEFLVICVSSVSIVFSEFHVFMEFLVIHVSVSYVFGEFCVSVAFLVIRVSIVSTVFW